MFCPNCGKPTDDNAAFCTQCGAPLAPDTAARAATGPDKTTLLGASGVSDATTMMAAAGASDATTMIPSANASANPTTMIPSAGAADATTMAPPTHAADETPTTVIPPSPAQSPSREDILSGFDVMVNHPENPTGSFPFQTTVAAPVDVPPASPAQPPTNPEPEPPKKKKHTLAIVLSIIAGVIVIAAIVLGLLWYFHEEGEKAKRQPHDVPLTIVADGYNDQCTKFPISVTGTDIDGAPVDQAFFVGADGKGVSLGKGTYTMTFPASPLTPDGILYNTPTVSVNLTLGDDLAPGQAVDGSSIGSITYTRSTALDETDEMIDAAVSWAQRDPSQTDRIEKLKEAAQKAHGDAVAAQAEKEAAARKAEADKAAQSSSASNVRFEDHRFITPYFTIQLPTSWPGPFLYDVDGAATNGQCLTYAIYDDSCSLPLLYVAVTPSSDPYPFRGTARQFLGDTLKFGSYDIVPFWTPIRGQLSGQSGDIARQFALDSGGALNLTANQIVDNINNSTYSGWIDQCAKWLESNVCTKITKP